MESQSSELERAEELIAHAKRIVAFTGAGISAESGIPTYRDADDSLWNRYDPAKFANIDYFLKDSSLFWNYFREVRYPTITGAKPNAGHRALVDMEKTGRLVGIITQNIDGLHKEAGSDLVVELHGTTRVIGCLDCGANFTMYEVFRQLEDQVPPPCKACGGRLKPRVVFFGEALPEMAIQKAAMLTVACDVLIAIGSSLQVYPAAAFPERAKHNGAGLIIINKTPTPYDSLADAVLRDKSGDVLPHLAGVLEESGFGQEDITAEQEADD